MADMKVDLEALRKRAPKFAVAADKLNQAFDELKTVQDAEGACWGNDDPGQQFDTQYTKALGEVHKDREFLTKSLNATKENLDKSADRWESDDHGSAEMIYDSGSAT